MNTKKLKTGEIIHDFRDKKIRWGWSLLSGKKNYNKTLTILGIGKGLDIGHFIALNNDNNEQGHKIEKLEYMTNPKDMFEATVSGVYIFEDNELD